MMASHQGVHVQSERQSSFYRCRRDTPGPLLSASRLVAVATLTHTAVSPLSSSSFQHLTLDLSSARVEDTLGHTSTPVFSVDCCLFGLFPGHAN